MPAVVSDTSVFQLGLIAELKPLLDELSNRHRFRIGNLIYSEALREAGERE